MIYRLDKKIIAFPNPRLGDPDGLFAVGGDLCVDRLLLAYSNGIFPWYSFRDCREIHWYCPMNRFVIFPEEIHVSHSMRTFLNKHADRDTCTIDNHFDGVIHRCSPLRYDEQGALHIAWRCGTNRPTNWWVGYTAWL